MDKLVVKELIQSALNKENLKIELELLFNQRERIVADYDKLSDLLNKKGASRNAAEFILKTI